MSDILIRGTYFPFPRNGYKVFRIYADGRVEGETGVPLGTAIELPEHGDLIDQDKLYELVKQRGKNWVGEWCDFECHISGNDIKNAPVVIPSSKETQNAN